MSSLNSEIMVSAGLTEKITECTWLYSFGQHLTVISVFPQLDPFRARNRQKLTFPAQIAKFI